MADVEEFAYVVPDIKSQKISFGSTKQRSTNPIGKDRSPFQKRCSPELFKHGPGTYNLEPYTTAFYPLSNKKRSLRGVGFLGSNVPRFKDKLVRTPSPGRYDVNPRTEFKQHKVPFLLKSKYMSTDNNNPGPATYRIQNVRRCRRTRFKHNFGKPFMVPAVEIKCISVPVDTCVKCQELCQGDYWQKIVQKSTIYLCHLCWVEEMYMQETFTKAELKDFEKLRNCSRFHRHEDCIACTYLMPANKFKKKLRIENYLEMFIDC